MMKHFTHTVACSQSPHILCEKMEKPSGEVTNLGGPLVNTLPWPDDLEASLLSITPWPPPSPGASGKRSPGGKEPGHQGSHWSGRQTQPPPSLTQIEFICFSDVLSQYKPNSLGAVSATESPAKKGTPICHISGVTLVHIHQAR